MVALAPKDNFVHAYMHVHTCLHLRAPFFSQEALVQLKHNFETIGKETASKEVVRFKSINAQVQKLCSSR